MPRFVFSVRKLMPFNFWWASIFECENKKIHAGCAIVANFHVNQLETFVLGTKSVNRYTEHVQLLIFGKLSMLS